MNIMMMIGLGQHPNCWEAGQLVGKWGPKATALQLELGLKPDVGVSPQGLV